MRDANQLAADVRWVVASAEVKDSDRQNALAALDELVGLVGTLQQEAALATTRQALTDMTDALPQSWDWYVGVARRALAATDGDTEEGT